MIIIHTVGILVPSMVSCTCFDTIGLISIKESGVARNTVTEQVIFSSLALSGDRVSWLMNVDSDSLKFKMTTLSLLLDKTVLDLDHVALNDTSKSAIL